MVQEPSAPERPVEAAPELAFELELLLRYQDTDAGLHASPTALLGAMQEAAIHQSDSLGRGMNWLGERHRVWMIVQTLLQIHRLPRWKARLRVSTWPSDVGRLLSRREFLVADEFGLCCRASTLWAYVDTDQRKVTRVPKELSNAYPVDERRAIAGHFPRPARCGEIDGLDTRPIRASDIDSNGHVNNLRYLAWMLDSLPEKLADSTRLGWLNIRYQKEALPGGRISARTSRIQIGQADQIHFAHEIINADTAERISMAESRWNLKPESGP